MDRIRAKELEIIKKVVYIAAVPLVILLLSGFWAQFKGFLFGLLMTLVAFHHIFVTGLKVFAGPGDKVRGRIIKLYLIRYIIYAAAIATAFMEESLDPVSVIIGLLMVKLVLVGDALLQAVKRYLHEKIEDYRVVND